MRRLLKVVNVVATAVIVVAVVVLLRVLFTPSGDVPSIFGYSFLRTLTGSMEPAIPVHSLVVVRECDANELQVGDVITYRATDEGLEGALNTHRITRVERGASGPVFTTKGDANAVEDTTPVAAANVVGKVVLVSGALGVAASLVANPLVFFPLVIVPLALLTVRQVVRAVRAASAVARAEDEAALRDAVRRIRAERDNDDA